jgi:amino acid adenylation domain-containing protein
MSVSDLDNIRFIERFIDSAQTYPEKTAVICAGVSTSYAELFRLVKHYAVRLGSYTEINAVVIYLPRDHRSIAALIACQLSGITYIPVDLSTGKERLGKIIGKNSYLLLHASGESNLPSNVTENQIFVHIDALDVAADYLNDISSNHLTLEQLAYLETYRIYTSGSTGEPKGVMVAEVGCCNLLNYFLQLLQITSFTTLLSTTSFAFDIFYLEYTLPLASGGTLILLTKNEIASTQIIAQRLQQYEPDIYQATPSLYKCILPYLNIKFAFKKLLVGGEALGTNLANTLYKKSGWLWNVYGPTETTVWSCVHFINRVNDNRIGKPIAKTSQYILKDDGEPALPGQEGYIYIGGEGVALGYYQNTALTEQVFVWKYIDGVAQRLYNTKDIGLIDEEGCLHYLRRDGDFIKINGFRVSPAEITNQLEQHRNVAEAAVITDTQEGEFFLVAYVKLHKSNLINTTELKEYLHQHLPPYMVPRFIFTLSEFFYTVSGKLDGNRLQEFYHAKKIERTEFLNNFSQDFIYELLEKYIGTRDLNETDNIFRLGLTSMQAVSLHLDLLEHNPQLELYQIFENPRISDLRNCVCLTELNPT